LAAVHIATSLGGNVIAVSRTQSKLDLATELGAVAVVKAGGDDVATRVADLTGGGAHVTVDALGDEQTAVPALQPAVTGAASAAGHLQ
jgi:alcohol dehydrogenase